MEIIDVSIRGSAGVPWLRLFWQKRRRISRQNWQGQAEMIPARAAAERRSRNVMGNRYCTKIAAGLQQDFRLMISKGLLIE
jgi:hypothetical protein